MQSERVGMTERMSFRHGRIKRSVNCMQRVEAGAEVPMAKAKDVEYIQEKESLLHLSIHKEIRLRI